MLVHQRITQSELRTNKNQPADWGLFRSTAEEQRGVHQRQQICEGWEQQRLGKTARHWQHRQWCQHVPTYQQYGTDMVSEYCFVSIWFIFIVWYDLILNLSGYGAMWFNHVESPRVNWCWKWVSRGKEGGVARLQPDGWSSYIILLVAIYLDFMRFYQHSWPWKQSWGGSNMR